MADIPHFALPFRVVNGKAVETEQDSSEEIANCVEAVLRYPRGFRTDLPEFGISDQTFAQVVDDDLIREEVAEWEDRTDLLTGVTVDELMQTVTVELSEEG